ncbi:13312_t:CDS:2 [Dentiscutata heterogama]|uniref:13312_t:CDS:1 n=1 Tax=Dentiscutata heterogama TaxID=1316150 RepID=A0ACA9KLA2_9GLOM|nr:13312_t:CDS:2 [Dentiscutata heterogama]
MSGSNVKLRAQEKDIFAKIKEQAKGITTAADNFIKQFERGDEFVFSAELTKQFVLAEISILVNPVLDAKEKVLSVLLLALLKKFN